ncbi:hypothetical protein FRB95_012154 [Tulasnella sp. JGI-2019a]|nr:hypothetical protein FRB95_012154 [Tulasnella sp. JGI-2019a]
MPGHTDIQTLSSLSTHEHDQSQRKRPLQDNGRDKLDTDRFNTTSARPRSHSRSRSPSRKKRATGRDTPPSCSSSSSSRSIPTGPRRSDQSSDRYRRSRSPLLPQSAINRRKEKRREVSPGDGYSRRVSGDRSRPTSPTSSFISSTHDFHSALPMRAQSRFGPPVNNGLQLPGDVTTTDPRCPPIELATDVIARQLALHEGLIKAEGTGVTEAYTENDVQREGTGVIYPRSRSSSSQVKSPVVTIEPSSSMEEHVMKTEAVPSPELLQVPQGNRDLRQPSDAFDDTDMKISPIREPVKLQPNTSPASPASPLVIPNVEPTIVTPQIPITVSNSESVRDRPSSLPRQISPPYIKQVRRLSVVGLGSDQVSLSPTISVASLPSSSTPQQRRFPSDERPLLPDVAQSIE